MEVEHGDPLQRTRRNMQPPLDDVTPIKAQQSISVTEMFNRQQKEIALATKGGQSAVKTTRSVAKDTPNGMARLSKIRSSSQSPHKVDKTSKKNRDMHPLAITFKDTSNDYRRHLYKDTTLRINSTLETLLTNLHGQSLHPISSEANDSAESPIRLSLPAKFERKAGKIYQPLSAYKISLTRTNTDGTRTTLVKLLEERMSDYLDYIEKHKAEIAKLEAEWEATVGEIWKVGVQCLGEKAMESMLFVDEEGDELRALAPTAEASLFVQGRSTSPPLRAAPTKKRVTFETPDEEGDTLTSHRQALHFLYQPTRLRVPPVPDMPVLSKEEIGALETRIKELGQKQLDDLSQAQKDYKLYWQKKNKMLAKVFGDD
ncbi:hypothetical protein DE146DRAFT_620182 [Phaeosphaeria sp. MPI-PUGE-AT-0046c]|nr:hypothetical protein DE146DRAFT_620182 [Phaeosphaeria sp. MPI-PUGE-AT-0046c]